MRKTKSDALWNLLSTEQREILDEWLFDKNLSFAVAWPRAQQELGFKGSIASLKRYYQRRKQERTLSAFKEIQKELNVLNQAETDVNSLRGGSMKLLSALLFRYLSEAPEKLKEWGPLAKLVVDNDRNEAQREMQEKEHKLKRELKAKDHEIRRELKAADHKVRREALALAKEKFEFKTTERALAALPQLQELAEAKKDPHLKRYAENAYWNRLRRVMFGKGLEIHPESAEEEAAMIAAKQEREERKARAEQMERDMIVDAQPPPPISQYYPEYMAKLAKRELANWEMCAEYEI